MIIKYLSRAIMKVIVTIVLSFSGEKAATQDQAIDVGLHCGKDRAAPASSPRKDAMVKYQPELRDTSPRL